MNEFMQTAAFGPLQAYGTAGRFVGEIDIGAADQLAEEDASTGSGSRSASLSCDTWEVTPIDIYIIRQRTTIFTTVG